MVLADYRPDDIQKAFTDHLKSNAVMPTPADITNRIDEMVSWREEQKRRESVPKLLPAKRSSKAGSVPWHGKMWGQFTQEDKAALAKHLMTLGGERRRGYVLYLQTHCGVPKEAFRQN